MASSRTREKSSRKPAMENQPYDAYLRRLLIVSVG